MRRSSRHADAHARSFPERALDSDIAGMKISKSLHEREPNSGPLLGHRGPLDSMEPLEEMRQIFGRNADPRIGHRQSRLPGVDRKTDADPAFSGELAGVGEEIQQNLLPHLRVDE